MNRPLTRDIQQAERPLSEQYRIAANSWVQVDAAARRLEELKSTAIEQHKQRLIAEEGDMPDSHAERRVKARPAWEKYIIDMVGARTEANRLKIEMECIRMAERELRDKNETIRAEMRLAR